MSTNIQIITRSLLDLNVIAEGTTPTADQGAFCLAALNALMETWDEDEKRLGFFHQSATGDTCPIPPWAEKGVAAALALDVAAHYGATVSAELGKKYDDGMAVISRQVIRQQLAGGLDMTHMPAGDGRRSSNIETDS